MIRAHTASIAAPATMTGSTPTRAIRWPVKNDGRNMATTCAWITVALSAKPNPHASMAIGVTVITSVITA